MMKGESGSEKKRGARVLPLVCIPFDMCESSWKYHPFEGYALTG